MIGIVFFFYLLLLHVLIDHQFDNVILVADE